MNGGGERAKGEICQSKGEVVMLYYPLNPDKTFVKRVIAEEGDMVRIVSGQVYLNAAGTGGSCHGNTSSARWCTDGGRSGHGCGALI